MSPRLIRGCVSAACALLAASCVVWGDEPEIDLSAGPRPTVSTPSEAPPKDRLVLAVAAVNSPMSAFEAYADLAAYLGNRLDMDAKFVGGGTYAEINGLVRSRDVQLAILLAKRGSLLTGLVPEIHIVGHIEVQVTVQIIVRHSWTCRPAALYLETARLGHIFKSAVALVAIELLPPETGGEQVDVAALLESPPRMGPSGIRSEGGTQAIALVGLLSGCANPC